MNTKIDELSKEFDAGLAAIRLAVGRLSAARRPWDGESSFDLVDQGDRMVRFYENWLLDDEQKQMLSVHPEDKFILYASSYLCDIGQTAGQRLPPRANDFKDDRARAFYNRSLSTRSCELIRDNWQDLGVPERAFVSIITRVCLQAADGGNFTPAESEATVTNDAAVNVTLLAACLQLCRTIDLKSPATILQIFAYMPKDNRISPGKLEAYFRVVDAGAHPSLNGTIRLRIQCTHPEVHRALKHHERFVQQLLEKLNQRERPRFLYSDVLYEIEPDGYTPIDLKFTVDSSAGLQLFMGNRLYSDKRVFLRELIQNAVDACNYRKLGDPSYSPAIALEFIIKTRKASSPGLMITINGLRDYFDVKVLEEDCPIGTEVTLHLRKSQTTYCRSMEYTGYLKTNIRFLKIPVELTDGGGNTTTIGLEQLVYDKNTSAGTVFVAPLKFMESEGYVRLGAKNHGTNIFALESTDGGVSVFQDGIFVTQLNSLLPEGAKQYVVTRINLVGRDKCELSMDRNRIFWKTDQLQNIKRLIRHGLVDVANQLMSAVRVQEVSVNTRNSIVNHLAIFFDFSDVDDVMYNQLAEPIRKVVEKRFRDFVRINFAHTLKKSDIAEADGYSEAWQQQVLENFAKK